MKKENVDLLNFSKDLFIDISNEIMSGFEEITLNLFGDFVGKKKQLLNSYYTSLPYYFSGDVRTPILILMVVQILLHATIMQMLTLIMIPVGTQGESAHVKMSRVQL